MPKQPCLHCGLPTWVPEEKPNARGGPESAHVPAAAVFCCTGCAFAHRLLQTDGTKRALTPLQVTAWLVGFAVSNQGLFWILSVLLRDEGSAALARGAGYLSIGLGGAVWLILLLAAGFGRRRSRADDAVSGLCFVVLTFALLGNLPGGAMAATPLLILWMLRGLFHQ